jgi:hypothetical protein
MSISVTLILLRRAVNILDQMSRIQALGKESELIHPAVILSKKQIDMSKQLYNLENDLVKGGSLWT